VCGLDREIDGVRYIYTCVCVCVCVCIYTYTYFIHTWRIDTGMLPYVPAYTSMTTCIHG